MTQAPELGQIRKFDGDDYVWVSVNGVPQWVQKQQWDDRGWALKHLGIAMSRQVSAAPAQDVGAGVIFQRLIDAIQERKERNERARTWFSPRWSPAKVHTSGGGEVEMTPAWMNVCGERVWSAEEEIRRADADMTLALLFSQAHEVYPRTRDVALQIGALLPMYRALLRAYEIEVDERDGTQL